MDLLKKAYVYVCTKGNRVIAVFDGFQQAIQYMEVQNNLDLPHSTNQESWMVLPIKSTLRVEKVPYNPNLHTFTS